MSGIGYILRDGSRVLDPRLGLLRTAHDPRDYDAQELLTMGGDIESRAWAFGPKFDGPLDQGPLSACVGFAMAHNIALPPVRMGVAATSELAKHLYFEAQRIDLIPGGEYPGAKPRSGGTDLRAMGKIAVREGYAKSFHFTYGLDAMLRTVVQWGPVLIGIPWFANMSKPSKGGELSIGGPLHGYHCVVVCAVRVDKRTVQIVNSWGPNWGLGGFAHIGWDDLQKLLLFGMGMYLEGQLRPEEAAA